LMRSISNYIEYNCLRYYIMLSNYQEQIYPWRVERVNCSEKNFYIEMIRNPDLEKFSRWHRSSLKVFGSWILEKSHVFGKLPLELKVMIVGFIPLIKSRIDIDELYTKSLYKKSAILI